jgi:hypothetical protein
MLWLGVYVLLLGVDELWLGRYVMWIGDICCDQVHMCCG